MLKMSKIVKCSRGAHPKNQLKRYVTNHQASLLKTNAFFYEPILQGEKVINTIKNIVKMEDTSSLDRGRIREKTAAVCKIFFSS